MAEVTPLRTAVLWRPQRAPAVTAGRARALGVMAAASKKESVAAVATTPAASTADDARAAQLAAAAATPLAADVPTFQAAIARLQDYWASVGCAVYLPHNTEVPTPARLPPPMSSSLTCASQAHRAP
jgi:hypothetical protein